MKKTINSVLALGVTAVFCVVASIMAVSQAEGAFSLKGSLDVFVLDAVLLSLIYYFFKPVRFYWALLCLLAAYAICALMGAIPDGRLLLAAAVFLSMGAASVFVKKVYFFPVKKLGVPLAVWLAVFVLLNIVTELVSGGSVAGIPVKIRVVSLVCGLIFGAAGMFVKTVTLKAYGVTVNRYFLVDSIAASRFMPKVATSAATAPPSAAGGSSVVIPKRTAAQGDDVKKSILDAKLAAMCSGQDNKENVPKSTEGSTKKTPSKTTTETGKIVSSVDFS